MTYKFTNYIRVAAISSVTTLLMGVSGQVSSAMNDTYFYGTFIEKETATGFEYSYELYNKTLTTTYYGLSISPPASNDFSDMHVLHSFETEVVRWDFDSLEEAVAFAVGNWQFQVRPFDSTTLEYATTPIELSIAIDALPTMTLDRFAPAVVSPADGKSIRSGDWLNIDWAYPDHRDSRAAYIQSTFIVDEKLYTPTLPVGISGHSAVGGGNSHTDTEGKTSSVYHRTEYNYDQGHPNFRQRITIKGYDLPVEVEVSIQTTNSLGYQSRYSEQYDRTVYFSHNYRFVPQSNLHYYVVPEPSTAVLGLLALAATGGVWWHRRK
ncbi:PEP-CTERM sorting domain-containing protein [Aeoliella mucimassa]|uniref:Ice-binding protein C-terminal domain-containing protein n=1 Tax=Aeoliella mucimassa TaxID=2527972 RepID=A0A518ANC7_9BACT|nr:PEP-CTERM sorting domain-containing protein [Aeoliella mucimassa]QDU56235.1 hypothetical protein Pan181_24430 [Aeoliella mucimassa]